MTDDSRPRAIAYLKSITDKEFAELVHEAVQARCQPFGLPRYLDALTLSQWSRLGC